MSGDRTWVQVGQTWVDIITVDQQSSCDKCEGKEWMEMDECSAGGEDATRQARSPGSPSRDHHSHMVIPGFDLIYSRHFSQTSTLVLPMLTITLPKHSIG